MIEDLSHRAWLGLTRNVAFTAPTAEDERLRGRTYAIPFDEVWRAAVRLLDGGLKRWELVEHDDDEGVIRGIARGLLRRRADSNITIRVSLDADAQTRVDALSASRVGRMDFGRNTRRLHRFFRALDQAVAEARAHPRGQTGSRGRGRETPQEATGA